MLEPDLTKPHDVIGCLRLRFASDERLVRYLGMKPGAISPLGILNDEQKVVEVNIDKGFLDETRFGCHPNDNVATAILACEDLLRLLKEHGIL